MEPFLLGYLVNTVSLSVSTLELVHQCDANRIWIHHCSKQNVLEQITSLLYVA
jgi:hypothetical protein